jgi:hypothetical protein
VDQRPQSQKPGHSARKLIKLEIVHINGRCMWYRNTVKNVYWITLFLVFGWLTACSEPPSDEIQLRQAVAIMEKAVEAKQSGPILDFLSADFQGNTAYRKANIRGMLLLHFRRNQHIHVYLRIASISIKDNQAQMQCQVILAGRDEKVLPQRGRVLVIDADWEKRDGHWRVVKAHWKDPLLHS